MAVNIALERAPEYLWKNIEWNQVAVLTGLSVIAAFVWRWPGTPWGALQVRENGSQSVQNFMSLLWIYAVHAVCNFVLLSVLSAVASHHGASIGWKIGLGLSGIILLAVLPTYLFARRSWKLLIIDWSYYALVLSISGFWLGRG